MIIIEIGMKIPVVVGIALWCLGKNHKTIYHLVQYFYPLLIRSFATSSQSCSATSRLSEPPR
ncbi:hypothetical protein ACSMDG_09210 [Yersinia proxima]